MSGTTWTAWGSGRVPVGVDTSQTEFSTVEKTGGDKTQILRAAIGATHADTGRIGYLATAKIPGINYAYSVAGGNVISDVPYGNINHSTGVYTEEGKNPTTVQPYITCYMWKRTA